jgi:hypothetical protein
MLILLDTPAIRHTAADDDRNKDKTNKQDGNYSDDVIGLFNQWRKL